MLRVPAVAALLAAALLLPAGPVQAHAELVSSDPPANSSLPEPPEELRMTFSEPIDAGSSSVQLLDPLQTEIDGLGELAVDGEATVATIGLPALEAGTYTVSYQVTSAVDGHVTSGIFAFLVDPTGIEPAPSLPTETSSLSSAPETIAARWLGLAAGLALAGTLIFWLLSARPVLPAAASTGPWGAICVAAALSFGGLVIFLALAARPLVDAGTHHPGFALDVAAPFGWTQFAIAMRVAVLGSFLAFVAAAARWIGIDEGRRRGRVEVATRDAAWLFATLAAAVVALAGMSFAGHAAASGGPLFAGIDLLHLLGAATWLGTLVGLFLLVRRERGAVPAALRRHSRVALAAAPIVVATGILNSPLVLGDDARELVASGYGNLLLSKALLFSVAAGMGAANFFLVRRRTFAGSLPLIGAELVVGAVAVLAAAGMVTGQPSAGRTPVVTSSAIGTAHLYGVAGASTVHAAINLPAPGSQRYQVSVSDVATGAYRDDVQRVFLVFEPPAGSTLPAERITLEPAAEPGLWAASGAYTPVVGTWNVEIIVRREGELDESTSFPLPVSVPLPPQVVPPPDTGFGVPAPLAVLWGALPAGRLGWLVPVAGLVVAGVLFGVSRRRRSAGLSVLRAVVVVVVVVSGIGVASRAAVQAANQPPAAAVARQNPVPSDDASLERGRALYLANCSVCHGPDGRGDGPAAPGMLPAPSVMGDVVPDMNDGALAYRIAVGSAGSRMPAFAATLSETDRWDIVNYLRSRWPGDD